MLAEYAGQAEIEARCLYIRQSESCGIEAEYADQPRLVSLASTLLLTEESMDHESTVIIVPLVRSLLHILLPLALYPPHHVYSASVSSISRFAKQPPGPTVVCAAGLFADFCDCSDNQLLNSFPCLLAPEGSREDLRAGSAH